MTTATDMNKMMQDMMSSFPMDTGAMQNVFKQQASIAEKMSKVTLEAAEKSTELSAKWMKDSLSRVGEVTRQREEPADYSKAVSDFTSAQAEMAAENMAAFAEIAKKVQMETVELMLAAGKEASEEATAAVKKATEDMNTASKKAASASK